MLKLRYSIITILVLFLFVPLLAVDTLNCIANYEFQSPIDELEIMNIRPLGDLNADGYDDWAYIFRDRNPFYPDDTTWVFFGSDTIDFTCDHILRARDIAPIGDVNNDGYVDIAYLVVDITNMYIMSVPKLYVLYGGPTFDFMPDDTCYVYAGGQRVVFSPIGTVGDINNDGYDDIYSGVSFQLNSSGSAKQYIYFGNDNISEIPDMILYPPSRIDTVVLGEYKWGWCYAPMGDIDKDGYEDFSIMYSDVPNWTDSSRIIYQFMGASSSDSIIANVDTLAKGFYSDFYQKGNAFGEENGIMLYNKYLHYIDLFSVDSFQTIYRFDNAHSLSHSSGDINNDGYDDWMILFPDPRLYQGYYGNTNLDTIPDFILPAINKPEAIHSQRLNSSFIGNVCGDGHDKLLVIESSKSFPSTTPTMYNIFCYSYNKVETSTETYNPAIFTLSQNYPNPFNPITTIQFAVPEPQHVKLQIFDITGRLVETLVDGFKEAGNWDVKWNAGNYSSGIYIYRLQYGDKHISRKMLVLK